MMVPHLEDSVAEEESQEPNEGTMLKNKISVRTNDGESPDSDEPETKWPGFTDSPSCVVQARFNITEIEVDNAEDTEQMFIQRLIEEGIPVKVLSESPAEDQSSIGIIVPPTLDQPNLGIIVPTHLHENQSNADATSAFSEASSSGSGIGNNTDALVNNIESFVEVTGLSKPISNNFFLHLVPSDTNVEEIVNADDMEAVLRRTSTNASLIKAEDDSQPVKKKVRFDLPNRKASLVGEYVIFRQPLIHDKNRKKNRRKEDSVDNEEEEGVGKERRKRKKGRIEFDEEQEEIQNFISYENETEEETRMETYEFKDDPNEDESSADKRCGCRSWTPRWIQTLARIEVYFVIFCIVALAQGMLFTYNMSVITSIQKRFKLTSKQAGFILSGNDITQIIITIFVSYYGSTGHRPKWMGYGALSSALAAFISATPHFIYGAGDSTAATSYPTAPFLPAVWHPSGNRKLELCGFAVAENCPTKGMGRGTDYSYVVFALFCSQMLIGISTAIYWTIGVSYLDDHISRKNTAFCFAIFTSLRVTGPTCGFLLGGYCLSFWIDPMKSVPFNQGDPKWIGAWWLGFVILSVCTLIPGLLYFCFPKELPYRDGCEKHGFRPPVLQINGTKEMNLSRNKKKISRKFSSDNFDDADTKSFRDLLRSLKRLFTNKIWAANLMSNATFVLAMSGYWNFKPKYMQSQFRTRANASNYYTGVTTMLASVGGVILSGIILRYVRPRAKYVTAYNVLLSIYAVLSLLVMMSIHCSAPVIAGHLPGQEPWACSSHCQCTEHFAPICAEDGVTTFFSPCYAGCTSLNTSTSPVEYDNCSCVANRKNEARFTIEDGKASSKPHTSANDNGYAVNGFCPSKCDAVSYYLFIQMITKILFASGRVAGILVNLRSVAKKDITLALGTVAACVTCVGFLPASYLMGSAIDGACLVWDRQCGKKGNCSFYDNDKFRFVMHLIPAGVLVISGIGDVVVYMNHSKLDLYGERDDDSDIARIDKLSNSFRGESQRNRRNQIPLSLRRTQSCVP